ncbi:hypothetical protein HKX48_006629 [Thoreauomyces humboldtii]|nr:hypothetical protein HKX48_006629 [Thoreauomyces humboldtii]
MRFSKKRQLNCQGLDIWDTQPTHVDFRVSPVQARAIRDDHRILSRISKDSSSSIQVLESDIGALIDGESHRLAKRGLEARDNSTWFQEYHDLATITAWFQLLANSSPSLVTFVPSIGQSVEGRDIFAVRITSDVVPATPKKQIFLEGLIHAREWISGAVVQYLANQLVEGYATNTTLLDAVEFVIVPVVNPDGYSFTWTDDRLWRKNRATEGGVDLNRNFDDHWDTGGSSDNTGDETYHGPSAASEPETQALQNYFLSSVNSNVIGAIDFHSYSQLILRPFGYTGADSPDEAAHATLGSRMAADILSVNDVQYASEKSNSLYVTSGTTTDWWYTQRRIYSYAVELRPNPSDGQGFILPPDQILATGEEILKAVTGFVGYALANPLPGGSLVGNEPA